MKRELWPLDVGVGSLKENPTTEKEAGLQETRSDACTCTRLTGELI